MTTIAKHRAAEKYRKSVKGKRTKKRWRKKNREKIRFWKRKWANSPKGLLQQRNWRKKSPMSMYELYRKSAKRRGLDFRLSKKQFLKNILRNCFYCGRKQNVMV